MRMPLYEYQCTACNERSEVLQRLGEAPLTVCPACGGALKKLISSPAFQFKGSGWYVTDYARKGGSGGDSASSASGSSGEASGGDAKSPGAKSDGGSADKSAAESVSKAEPKAATESKDSQQSKESRQSAGSKATPGA
jgi:putative FmdB family regulatory protein